MYTLHRLRDSAPSDDTVHSLQPPHPLTLRVQWLSFEFRRQIYLAIRNTFCRTWYLSTNLTSPSTSLAPISCKTREFRDLSINKGCISMHIFHCACAKRPHFYIRSVIWRHYRVPRPRFHVRTREVRWFANIRGWYIGLFFAWVFKNSWPKIGVSRGNRGKMMRYWSQRTRSYFWGYLLCAKFGKNQPTNATMRVCIHGRPVSVPCFSIAIWGR